MKQLKYLLSLLVIMAGCTLYSCGKGEQTPVDQYVDVIEQTTKNVENLKEVDLTNMQELLSPQAAHKIAEEYADYQLTDKDKDKLKKSCRKLMKAVYKKVLEYDQLNEAMKQQLKGQEDMVVSAVDQLIDHSQTLGQIDGR